MSIYQTTFPSFITPYYNAKYHKTCKRLARHIQADLAGKFDKNYILFLGGTARYVF